MFSPPVVYATKKTDTLLFGVITLMILGHDTTANRKLELKLVHNFFSKSHSFCSISKVFVVITQVWKKAIKSSAAS